MIHYQKEETLFHLKTREFSYIMQVLENGQLVHRYFGKKIRHFSSGNKITFLDRSFSPSPFAGNRTFSLDTLSLEYSSNGLGDFRTSSIEVGSDKGTGLDLKYVTHRILSGKPHLEGLPNSFGTTEEVETLEIDLYDSLQDVIVTLSYSVFEKRNYLARSVAVHAGQSRVQLEKVYSFILDAPHSEWDIHTLTGRYAYEKQWTKTPLTSGKYSIGSLRGASSHSRTPFIALASKDATEDKGEIYSAQLVYSGNFVAFAEKNPLDTTRWGMGLNDESFSWLLEPGQVFQAPEVLLSYTDRGFTEMTHDSHDFIRHHICRGNFVHRPRPILINNWEATYFDFTEESILALAETAQKAGIELFVLDDGWFGHRNNDESSLGDWKVNLQKLPNGLIGLAEKVHDLGMEFGIWVEPEMISVDSDLYRQHSDWAIQITNRPHTVSREQLVLDLSQEEVCNYVIEAISAVLASAPINYVKWDMNRNITNIPETSANAQRNEFFHRYMLGFYRILEELTSRFPTILFESCSGGGGRNDLGLLYYMPQAWASDNTDAISRLSIQDGTSLIFPSISMGSHVSAVPNHQVGRITPLETRGNVAMLGNLGYELDLNRLSEEELAEVAAQTAIYRDIRDTVQFGTLYRLQRTDNTRAYNYVNVEQTQVVFTFVKILSQPEAPLIQVRLKGLQEDALYECKQLGERFYGDELMNVGLTMPYVQKDYFSLQYIFEKVES